MNNGRHSFQNKISQSMFLRPIDFDELKNTIASLKNKSGGIDGIHASTLKTLCKTDGFVYALLFILNSCFFSGHCPSQFKIAEVIPVFKTGDREEPDNYRPISLISNIAKIFEKLLHSRILSFINKHKILSKFQFGFRKGTGANNSIATITELLYQNMDKSLPTAAVFLDLAKAFDTVDHGVLLNKLY